MTLENNKEIKDEDTFNKEIERYARQLLIDEWDQKKLSKSTIFIAGVGALGSIVALNLAVMGVGKLILCDYDTVEISNLSRQIVFFEDDIGKYKVEAAKNNLMHWNSNVKIITYNTKLQKLDRSIFEKCDVIIDGLDTFSARRYLNSVAISVNKPLIHGGLFGWFGNVQFVIPKKTACLECQPLIPQNRLQKPCTPPGQVRREETQINNEIQAKIPSIISTNSIIAGIQTQLALKILFNLKLPEENFIFYDGLTDSFTKMKLNKNPKCIVCSDKYRIEGVNFAVSLEDTIRDIKDRIILTWGLQEPFKIMYKGKILSDDIKINSLNIKNKDTFFVWNKNIIQPMKFYAILTDKE